MSERLLVKILRPAEWDSVLSGEPVVAPVDIADGYVHFSSRDQVQSTLDKWFSNVSEVVLLAFDANDFSATLKWEPAREGDLFPHVYGIVSGELVKRYWRVTKSVNEDRWKLPADLQSFELE